MKPRPTIVFWSLLTVIAIWRIINTYIDPGVTMGEALGILTTALLAVVSSIYLVCKKIRTVRPFKMVFSRQPPGDTSSKVLEPRFDGLIGMHEIHLKVDTRVKTEISELDVRFVNKTPFFEPRDVSTNTAKIVSLSVYGWKEEADRERDFVGPNTPVVEPFEPGGMKISVRKSKNWTIGSPLWVTLGIDVQKPWSGYLSFRSHTDRRTPVRCKTKFRDKW